MQDDHCAGLVREADKDRFLASLFAPADRRGDLLALYAFNVEIGRVRVLAREPLPGEMRLQWWREVLDGARPGEALAHPVAAALLAALQRHGVSPALLSGMIDAHSFDLYDEPMETVAQLEDYAGKTSSALFHLAMQLLAVRDQPFPDIFKSAGFAQALTELLRAFPLHAARRQLYVPDEILQRHGASRDDIFVGRDSTSLRAALAELRIMARRHLASISAPLAALPANLVPALLPVALVRPYLDRMERPDYSPFATPVEIAQWRRQWRLWRAARRPALIAG